MTSSYVGEIRIFAGNFAPADWALCDGGHLWIAENQALFDLIGTTYGGDGRSTFAVPDLRGRLPVHQGAGLALAQAGGSETVTLTGAQVPAHSHQFLCTADEGARRDPTGNVPAAVKEGSAYDQSPPTAQMAPPSLGASPGSGQPHDNIQPYLCLNFIISLSGIFPTQT